MSECISSFFGFISNLNPIKQVTKSGKKRAIFRCIFTIFTLLGQNNIRSILRVECTDVKIGRQEPPNFRRFIFLPWRFEQLRFAQPQPCCVPDLGQAARSSFVCKPTRLTDERIPYAMPGERSRKIVNISLKCAKDIRLFTVRKIFTSITNTYFDTLKYIQKRLRIIYK